MQEKIIVYRYKSPYGELLLGSLDEKLCLCDWAYRRMRSAIDRRIMVKMGAGYSEGYSGFFADVIAQLEEYFAGVRQEFTIPLVLAGTDFQVQVWEQLLKIPYGQTRSYIELAGLLGNPDAVRAVAAANGANAISILVPCHRIVGANGELTGYAGGLDVKRKLLRLEQGDRQGELFDQ